MRLITTFMMSFFVLTACTNVNDTSGVNNVPSSEEQSNVTDKVQSEDKVKDSENMDDPDKKIEPEEIELTAEEKLLQALPVEVEWTDWNLILVNPWEALPESFEPQLITVDNEQQINSRIVDAWESWKEAASTEGHRLFFVSGYRGIELQAFYFDNTYASYINQGFSKEEALSKTKEYLTEPGHSEHHTGLALDIVDEEWNTAGRGLEEAYETQQSQQWLVATMADYGFILRYPLGKEEITGIQYEPWHFRYVGEESAQFMVDNQLVLEEYIDLLKMRDASN